MMAKSIYTVRDLERLHKIEAAARNMLSIWRSKCRPGAYHRWLLEMSAAESALDDAIKDGEKESRQKP